MSDLVKHWSLGLYAPGNYHCICSECRKEFIGDKRAIQCLSCAGAEAADRIAQLEAEVERLTNGRDTMGNLWATEKARAEQLEAALRPFACKCSVKGMGAGGNCTRGTGECDCWNARAALEERT